MVRASKLFGSFSVALVVAFGAVAHAQSQSDWTLLGWDTKGDRWFTQVGSPRIDGRYVVSVVKYVPHHNLLGSTAPFDYEIDTRVDDCTGRLTTNVRALQYRNNGQLIQDQSFPISQTRFIGVGPGSINASLSAYACDAARGGKPMTASVAWASFGSDWTPLGNTQAASYFYLPQSVRQEKGIAAIIVNEVDAADKTAPSTGAMYRSSVGMLVVNCQADQFGLAAADYYDVNRILVSTFNVGPSEVKFAAIPRGSIGESIAKTACASSSAGQQQASNEPQIGVGTGWLSDKGYLVTASHVIAGAKRIMLYHAGEPVGEARVTRDDPANDVAILTPNFNVAKYEGLRVRTAPTPMGSRVFTLGYPIPDKVGLDLRVTSGDVNALSGIAGDARFMQISVPVTHGNSGGPLIDESGQVVGIINYGLDAKDAQNANFALKSVYVEAMMADLPTHATRKEPKVAGDLAAKTAELRDGVFMVVVEVDPDQQRQ